MLPLQTLTPPLLSLFSPSIRSQTHFPISSKSRKLRKEREMIKPIMKSHSFSLLLFFLLLATVSLSLATSRTTSKTQNPTTKPNPSHSTNPDTSLPGYDPVGGFSIPGFGNGNPFNVPGFAGGWGGGSSGPSGGHAYGGVVVPSVVCSDKGPCFKKRVTCPKKCFSSYSRSGKNYGAGGGGGGCTIDCKKHCIGYC